MTKTNDANGDTLSGWVGVRKEHPPLAIFILLLLVCVVQWMRPTLLVWGLLVCLFSAYAAEVIATPHNGTFSDYLFFSLCGAGPAVVLLFGRPKGSMSAVAQFRQLP